MAIERRTAFVLEILQLSLSLTSVAALLKCGCSQAAELMSKMHLHIMLTSVTPGLTHASNSADVLAGK